MKAGKRVSDLTACEVRHITGVTDDDIIQLILASGASKKEIQQACEKCNGVPCTKAGVERPMTAKTHKIQNLIECGHSDFD